MSGNEELPNDLEPPLPTQTQDYQKNSSYVTLPRGSRQHQHHQSAFLQHDPLPNINVQLPHFNPGDSSLLNYQTSNQHHQKQQPHRHGLPHMAHFGEELSPDLFTSSHENAHHLSQQNAQTEWDSIASQVVNNVSKEMSVKTDRELSLVRTACLRTYEFLRDRITNLTNHNNQLQQILNGYKREFSYSFPGGLEPFNQMMHSNPPNPYSMDAAARDPEGTLLGKRRSFHEVGATNFGGTGAGPNGQISKKSRTSYASKWSEAQDQALRAAVERFEARNWKAIAEFVPGRDHVQCLQRWKKVLRPGLRKGTWSAEEDQLLLTLIQDEKMHSWAMVASKIPGRTAKQCRERWSLNLDPNINRSPWTVEEDELLLKLYDEQGGKWSEIKSQFNGRTENSVKTRFKSLNRAKAREWSPEQDAKLIELRMKWGKNWAEIKKEMPFRSKNAIKVRCKTLEYDHSSAPTLHEENNESSSMGITLNVVKENDPQDETDLQDGDASSVAAPSVSAGEN